MVKKFWVVVGCLGLLYATLSFGADTQNEHGKTEKKGILLVTFGTSIPEAQAAFDTIDKKVKATYPNVPIRWAYTSHMIRNKLKKMGKHLDSVESALSAMMDEGFTHIAIQSLHMIPGAEFHDLQTNAKAFANMSGGFKKVRIGYPLLATTEDLKKATAAIIKNIPKERTKEDAVILMGHGSHHPADVYYEAMMYRIQQIDPNIYLGTVEGSIEINDIKSMIVQKGVKKAYLMPFMSVAGDHARNDMAGDEKDSWKSILEAVGIQCIPILKGVAEYDDFVNIWLDHLKSAMDEL